MQVFNNERGGTLVMVLLLVIVFTIVGIGLLTMNISASKQFDKKEEQVQARHLAEMGILHYQAAVDEAVRAYNISYDTEAATSSFEDYMSGLLQMANGVRVGEQTANTGKYIVTGEGNGILDSSSEKIVFAVTSEGFARKTSKVVEAEVTVSSLEGSGDSDGSGSNSGGNGNSGNGSGTQGNGGTNPLPESDVTEKVSSLEVNNESRSYKGSLDVLGSAKVGTVKDGQAKLAIGNDFFLRSNSNIGYGQSSQTEVNVGGNMKSKGSIDFGHGMYSETKVVVGGDFTVEANITIGNGQDSITGFAIGGDFISSTTVEIARNHGSVACVIVYGNARLSNHGILAGSDGKFYVYGETYINGVPQGNTYKPPANLDQLNCPALPSTPDPDDKNPPNASDQYNWAVEPDVHAVYKK